MDFWQRARSFAEEAARKSQELTEGFGSAKLSDVVSEASKRSKELAAEASKKSKELAAEASKMSKEFTTEALKRADQITAQIPPASVVLTNLVESGQKGGNDAADLEKFGVTDELREFVKGITTSTFRDFPLDGADDPEVSDIPTVSNVRQDLTKWQERHAKLVLSTVKEISKLRYQLCPRVMKERKFWRIYFILVNSYVAPYEKLYMEDVKLKETEKAKDTEVKETSSGVRSEKADETSKPKSNNMKPAASEQDLDVFLLGDLEESDDGRDDGGDGDNGFDDDFDKL